MKRLFFALSILMFFTFRSFADTTYYHIQPIDTNLFNQNYPAEFSWFVPDSVDSIQAVYFFINGVWGSSLNIVSDSAYIPLAKKHNAILMGCKMHPLMSREAHIWGADAALNALDSLSSKMGKSYVKDLPLFLEGYSLGGQYAYHFTRVYPERVIGYTTMKGGVHDTTVASQQARAVPSLWFMGEFDTQSRIDNLTFIYNQERGAGALTALLIDQGGFHDRVYDTALIYQFFRSSLAYRVDGNSTSLIPLADSFGYAMDDSSFYVSPYSCAPFQTDSNSWFIDSLVAIEGQRFASNSLEDSLYVCLINAIKEEDLQNPKGEFLIYPNPTSDQLTISAVGVMNFEIGIMNSLGQEFNVEYRQEGEDLVVNFSTLSPGLYMLRISDGKREFVEKVMIE